MGRFVFILFLAAAAVGRPAAARDTGPCAYLFVSLYARGTVPTGEEIAGILRSANAVLGKLAQPPFTHIEMRGPLSFAGTPDGNLPLILRDGVVEAGELVAELLHEYGHHVFLQNAALGAQTRLVRYAKLAGESEGYRRRIVEAGYSHDGMGWTFLPADHALHEPSQRVFQEYVPMNAIVAAYEEFFADVVAVAATRDPEVMARMYARQLSTATSDAQLYVAGTSYFGRSFLNHPRPEWDEVLQVNDQWNHSPHLVFARNRSSLWLRYLGPAAPDAVPRIVEGVSRAVARCAERELDRLAANPDYRPDRARQGRELDEAIAEELRPAAAGAAAPVPPLLAPR